MFPFNVPLFSGKELKYLKKAVDDRLLSGNGSFAKKCASFLEEKLGCAKALMTTSCTHSLEMASMLSDIKEGDEVIMPSYTFTSTANAFVLRGAKIVFIDIRKDTMNMDEKLVEGAITEKTKAIVPVHYGGVPCEMDEINEAAKKHNVTVIEDAAQALMSLYNGEPAGSLGDMACFSFHETKNFTCGEGGAIALNGKKYIERAEIIWEKGTDRSKFFRGEVDKYTWVDAGSSYLLSELNAAYLWAQFEIADKITAARKKSWEMYFKKLKPLEDKGLLRLPVVPGHCAHNGHMFYIMLPDPEARGNLIKYLREKNILAIFHYIPLHSSPAGKKFGRFHGNDANTTMCSRRIIRLPLFYGIKEKDIDFVVKNIKESMGRG